MGQTYTGLSGKTKDDFGHGQARFVTYMNVFSNPISNPEMTEPIEIDPKQNEVEVGDVFFTTSSETPEEVGMSSILLEKRGKTYLNSFCFGFRPSEKIDSYYLAYMLRSESTRAKIILLAQGISRYNISKNKVMEIAVSLPSLDEQKMIGQYFSQLDNLITLHQRKYLQKKKTSLTWEQRKLDDWGTFYYGKSCPKWSVTEDSTTPCIRYGELYTKFGAKIDRVYSYTNMSPENLRFSKGTEVLIPRVGEDPMDYNHCTWLSMPNVAIGEMISVFNTDNNPLFTAMMFNATLQNEFAMRVEGGSVTNLYFEKLKSIEVSFPSIPEQEKIAAYFDSIDHLITLHRRAHFHRRRRTYK